VGGFVVFVSVDDDDHRHVEARQVVEVGREVVETVGEATWERSLRMLGRGGRLVTCGGTSGSNVATDVRRLFWFQWDILGSTMGGDGDYRAVTRVLAQGNLRPTVDSVHALNDARNAFEHLQRGDHLGKVVVDVGGRANEPARS